MHKLFKQEGVVGDPLLIENIPKSFEYGYVWVEFFTNDTYEAVSLTTPTTATLDVTASENGFGFGNVVLALDVSTTAYDRPTVSNVTTIQGTLSSVTGDATHWRLNADMYGNRQSAEVAP
jgi:hypothetical protein